VLADSVADGQPPLLRDQHAVAFVRQIGQRQQLCLVDAVLCVTLAGAGMLANSGQCYISPEHPTLP